MSQTRIVVCCGSGGVGKTTASAALALKWALAGQKVAVLTIDPARRLADSLGLESLGNAATAVDISALSTPSSAPVAGSLDALMLDAKETFDHLVRTASSSPEAAERILANRYYRFASTRLGGSHEYMAMERLLELWEQDTYDVVVLDTPPTRQALDFLTAPDRMGALMDDGVLSWLVMPASATGWRALELGSEVVARVLKRLLGRGTVGEIAEFFDVFKDLMGAFQRRTRRVRDLLGQDASTFLLVCTPAPTARAEALAFLEVLGQRALPFGGFLVNRTARPPAHPLTPQDVPSEGPLSPERWAEVRQALLQTHASQQRQAAADAESIAALQSAGPAEAPCWTLPDLAIDLHDLPGLHLLSADLPDRV